MAPASPRPRFNGAMAPSPVPRHLGDAAQSRDRAAGRIGPQEVASMVAADQADP